MSKEKKKIGDVIFADIEENAYLNELYENILYNYALRLFQLDKSKPLKPYNLIDALRFADILSKSNHPERKDAQKMWAQEIVILLNQLEENNPLVKLYAGSVFSSTGNHQGLKQINADYEEVDTVLFLLETSMPAAFISITPV